MKYLFRGKKASGSHDFWMSYTDLMAGFLIIFIIATIISDQNARAIYNKYKEYEGRLVNINEHFIDIFPESEGCEIIDSLGCIRIYPKGGEYLFENNCWNMEYNLKERLVYKGIGKRFVQKAMQLVEKGKNIEEIRIEGHADTTGSFMHNLELSSKRAYNVYECIYKDCGLTDIEKSFVEKYMIAVGYSTAKPVIEDGKKNLHKSRRVEFKIISSGFSAD